jgi:catechol 2,3-dioxygenase-like lactoylglutathione lyase family enzyme
MKGIRHTGIVVKDMEGALYFYRDLLGFKIVKKMQESGNYIDTVCGVKNVSVTTIKLSADDNNLIELLYFLSPVSKSDAVVKGLTDKGFTHISFTVENIDAIYDYLRKAGIHFNSSPQVSSDGYAKVAFCRDPEGNFIELVEVLVLERK